MTSIYESKYRKTTILYDKDHGLAYDIEKTFQSPVKRSLKNLTSSSPEITNIYCCACQELVGGRLYTCCRCNSSFHSICHFPPLPINTGKTDRPKKWICHRCEIELENDLDLITKTFSDIQQKEDAYNSSLVRFLINKDNGRSGDKNVKPGLQALVPAMKAINSREFSLDKLNIDECYYKLPFDEVFHKDEPNQNRKTCFFCKKYVERTASICCDYCKMVFCFDCLNPPIAALQNERFMCPFHVERFIDSYIVNSLRVTERIALWKEHTNLLGQDLLAIFRDFYRKCKYEEQLSASSNYASARNALIIRSDRKTRNSSKFKVNNLVKKAYSSVYAANSSNDNVLLKHSNSIAANANDSKIRMKNGTNSTTVGNQRNFQTYNGSLQFTFYKPLFNCNFPVYAALNIYSGIDMIPEAEGNVLIPIQSHFITMGADYMANKHSIDLSRFSSCKALSRQQTLIFFDKSKFVYEIVSNNVFPDNYEFDTCRSNICKCTVQCSSEDGSLEQLDVSRGIIPSMRPAVLWNGALIRIGCLSLLFVCLNNL